MRQLLGVFVAGAVCALAPVTAVMAAEPPVAAPEGGRIAWWVTTFDGQHRLERQPPAEWADQDAGDALVRVDPEAQYQTVLGFGGSVFDRGLYAAPAELRDEGMRMMYSRYSGIGLSAVRVPIRAKETYNDMPPGQTDPDLKHFSTAPDLEWRLPYIRAARELNPELIVMATPWSAPAWMKDSQKIGHGRLKREYYQTYVNYLVRWVKDWHEYGVPIDALTFQNEPGYEPGWYAGMKMSPGEQQDFVQLLGPALRAAGLATRILAHDHNTDAVNDVLDTLGNPAAKRWYYGTAFHGYSGWLTEMAKIREAHPDRALWFTEATGVFPSSGWGGSMDYHLTHFLGESMRQWGQVAMLWKLDIEVPSGVRSGDRPFVGVMDGGSRLHYYGEYYETAHFSRFLRSGARRIAASEDLQTRTLAFRNADGSTALVLHHRGEQPREVTISYLGRSAKVPLPARSVATLFWRDDELGAGLLGTYERGPIRRLRQDAQVSFRWTEMEPPPTMETGGFSAVWKGRIMPAVSGEYRFVVEADGSVRLSVGSDVLIARDSAVDARSVSRRMAMHAGMHYPVELRYRHVAGDRHIQLRWIRPDGVEETVPRTVLYPPQTPLTPPQAPGRVRTVPQADGVRITWAGVYGARSYRVERIDTDGAVQPVGRTLGETELVDVAAGRVVRGALAWRVASENEAGASSMSSPARLLLPEGPLPPDWKCLDIGEVQAGAVGMAEGKMVIQTGGSQLWGKSDRFRFVCQRGGKGAVVARIVQQEANDDWAKSGLMLRASAEADAPYVMVAATGGNGAVFQYRSQKGAEAVSGKIRASEVCAPVYLKLDYGDGVVSGWHSSDGKAWHKLGQACVDLGDAPLVGVAAAALDGARQTLLATTVAEVLSTPAAPRRPEPVTMLPPIAGRDRVHIRWTPSFYATQYRVERQGLGGKYLPVGHPRSDSLICTVSGSEAENYRVVPVNSASEGQPSTPVSVTPHGDLPSPWIAADIGQPVPGRAVVEGSAITVAGNGTLWGRTDACHYVYQPLSGDGTMIARIVSMEAEGVLAKCGIMVRDGVDPSAATIYVVANPITRATCQYRPGRGMPMVGGGTPGEFGQERWLRVTRSGDEFTAFWSSDGVVWNEMMKTDIPMAPEVQIGLVSSAQHPEATATATFDSISLMKP